MEPKQYFMTPQSPEQKKYDALRAYYRDAIPAREVAAQFGYTPGYFKKLRSEFRQALKKGQNPFFPLQKPGPKARNTSQTTMKLIVALRKKNYSIQDIRMALSTQNISVGLNTIDQILKDEGFSPLPRRTHLERHTIISPQKFSPPKCQALTGQDEILYTVDTLVEELEKTIESQRVTIEEQQAFIAQLQNGTSAGDTTDTEPTDTDEPTEPTEPDEPSSR